MEQNLKFVLIVGLVALSMKTAHQAVNVAPRGRATQSTEPASAEMGPDKAINSYQNPEDSGKTCASVPTQDAPWWQVDLKSIYHISAVSVIGVEHCCQEQLDRAEIRIGLRNDTENPRCAIISTVEGQYKYDYQFEMRMGRFVHVVLPGRQRNLTLCEVLVYGTVLENVALRGVAYQSSSRWKTTGKASNVIDGVQFTTCSATQDKPGQWVKVDLLVPHNVSVIQLAFEQDCCYQVEVHVDNTRCSGIFSSFQSLVTLDCGGIVGRSVTVFHPDEPLTLCEVEIFSTWEQPENQFPQRPPPSDYCSFDYCSRDYIFPDKEPMTWSEAKNYCRERYTDLAVVDSPRDMNRIVDKMDENNLSSFWIGLYEDKLTWRWSMADEVYFGDAEAEFRNWAPGEPNNQAPQCVGIRDTGGWQDLDCGLLNYFLCFDGSDSGAQAKVLVRTSMKWTDAQQYCRDRHTDLISVRTLAENEEIRSMVPAGTAIWIGLFGDTWKWSDGRDNLFRYWQRGRPESKGNGSNCAYVDGGAWRGQSCDTKAAFLCYYYKKRSVLKISSDFNTCDPVIQRQLLKQLEAKMKNDGVSDFKIHWRRSGTQASPEGPVSPCVSSKGGEA